MTQGASAVRSPVKFLLPLPHHPNRGRTMSTGEAWDAMWLALRRAAACVLMMWVLKVTPKSDKNTLIGIYLVLTGMTKDDRARDRGKT